jgi:putative tryptophan/tyrosine transport system substrate-binding protein
VGLLISVSTTHAARIAELAAKNRIPSMWGGSGFTDAGGLISYGIDERQHVCDVVRYIDRILKGARPSDLPIEQATKFELVINLKTAKALGLTIPPSLLLRADQVIE